jgi:hypothetical protein
MIDDPQQLWSHALTELELQMTRATFDTWLRNTRCIDYADDTLVIACMNSYAVEWLENRLYPVIQRTLGRLTENGTRARFIVEQQQPRPGDKQHLIEHESQPEIVQAMEKIYTRESEKWDEPDFDPSDTKKVAGWIPLSEYATLFWAPLLGAAAWRVWELVRRNDKRREKTEFTPPLRFSVPQLAKLVPCAQQSLTGRNVRCDPDRPGAQQIEAHGGRQRISSGEPELIWAVHYPGALEILEREGIAEIERIGKRKGAVVIIAVRVNLPLLHPSQVEQLAADLQADHDRWVGEHGLDPVAWQ